MVVGPLGAFLAAEGGISRIGGEFPCYLLDYVGQIQIITCSCDVASAHLLGSVVAAVSSCHDVVKVRPAQSRRVAIVVYQSGLVLSISLVGVVSNAECF